MIEKYRGEGRWQRWARERIGPPSPKMYKRWRTPSAIKDVDRLISAKKDEIRRFKKKMPRNLRQRLTPSPFLIFEHPLLKKTIQLEVDDISTSGWQDGNYIVKINAIDMINNSASLWYLFTIDSTAPEIQMNSPSNNSLIQSGSVLDFSIIDSNLKNVNYSINGADNVSFASPYNISTSGWNEKCRYSNSSQ